MAGYTCIYWEELRELWELSATNSVSSSVPWQQQCQPLGAAVGNGSPVGLIVQAVSSFQRVIRVSFQCVIWVAFDKSPQTGIPQQQFGFNASNSLGLRAAGVCKVGYALP